MASRFSQIVDAIETELDDSSITFYKFRLAAEENDRWPLVVWIPISETYGAPRRVGGQVVAAQRQTPCLNRAVTAEVHIWGGPDTSDIEVAEQMLHSILSATYRAVGIDVEFVSAIWQTQQADADYDIDGELCVVTMTFHIPVMRVESDLSAILSSEHSSVFQGESGDVADCNRVIT